MRSNKINLILMKDGGQTHKWNVNQGFLCFLVGTLIIIPILFVLSIWLNIHLYSERNNATQKHIELQYTVDRNAQTIARLSNLESFLRDHSPSLLGLLVSQSSVDMAIAPTIAGNDEKLVRELNNFIDAAGTDIKTRISVEEKNEETKVNIGKEAITEANIPKTTEATTATSTKDVPAEELPVTDIQQRIDFGYVSLENVVMKLVGKDLYIQYHLQNTGKTVPLAGHQEYTLVTVKNGKVERISLTNVSDDQFRIKNLKIVKSKIPLTGIEVGKMARIQTDIVQGDKILFRETYPISR